MNELFDPKELPIERKKHPRPVLMRPDEILSLQRAAHIAGRSTRRIRDLGDEFGISRQIGENARLEFSAPGLHMVLQGRFDQLERFRNGDRESPDIREYFDLFGIPGPEILPNWVDPDGYSRPAKDFHKRAVETSRPNGEDGDDLEEGAEMFDERGNDRSVALMLNGGNVLRSFRNELVAAANREGMSTNAFVLIAVGKQLQSRGTELRGVFFPGDLSEDR
jgi:hypothetical protein